MKRKHKISGALAELAGNLFETPSGAVPGGWSVTLTDGREAYITGCRAILSYDDLTITIDAGDTLVKICGEGLDIARYCDREITVRGNIASVTREDAGC